MKRNPKRGSVAAAVGKMLDGVKDILSGPALTPALRPIPVRPGDRR